MAHGTIGTAVRAIQDKKLSIWMFPEGTRSYGRGLLPFKTGAFHTGDSSESAGRTRVYVDNPRKS